MAIRPVTSTDSYGNSWPSGPTLFEKIQEQMVKRGKKAPKLKEKLSNRMLTAKQKSYYD